MSKRFLVLIAGSFFIYSCGKESVNLTAPESASPVTAAAQLAGSWTLENCEINGVQLSTQIIRNEGKNYFFKSFSGQINFTPTSQYEGTLNCSENATVVSQSDGNDVRSDSLVKMGSFLIPKPGIIVITLSPQERENLSARTFTAGISGSSGQLVIDYLDEKAAPALGNLLVGGDSLNFRVSSRYNRVIGDNNPGESY